MIRRHARQIELLSIWVMVLGVVSLCQPWSLFLHCYGATIILSGLVLFNIFSRIKSTKGKPRAQRDFSSSDGR